MATMVVKLNLAQPQHSDYFGFHDPVTGLSLVRPTITSADVTAGTYTQDTLTFTDYASPYVCAAIQTGRLIKVSGTLDYTTGVIT